MRTTLNLDERLLQDAQRATGLKEKTAVIHRGLEVLVAREAAKRLAALGGTMPKFTVPPRRRPPKS